MNGRRAPVSGVILAGGRGLRMGGRDKGLIRYNGAALVESVIAQLAPQVDELIITANRNLAAYERFGCAVHRDVVAGYQGPLAGMLTGLEHARHARMVCVPCDTQALPVQYVARLLRAVSRGDCQAAYAHDGNRAHPVFALLQRDCRDGLSRYLSGGGRRVEAWLQQIAAQAVVFPELRDGIANINGPDDLAGLPP
jgi:molybdopterin-guanine dinucleotide biosynthesis protein A